MIDPSCEFGPGVDIEAEEVEIGPGARIGFSGSDDFRTVPGVRIRVRRLSVGARVGIGRSVRIDGGSIDLAEGVRIHRQSTINVSEHLDLGAFGTVNERCEISGRDVRIGQQLWMLPGAKIGGGSAFESASSLVAGHYLHLGVDTLVNTARPVRIGHEVGLGTRTAIYTHGAYPSALHGFPVAFEPVEIGDFTWVPGATINPGVRIGRNCVIGVNSLVTRDIPDGCLAAGSPAKVIKEEAYPRRLSSAERRAFFELFLRRYAGLLGSTASLDERPNGAVAMRTRDAHIVMVFEDEITALPDVEGGLPILLVSQRGHGIDLPDGVTFFDTQSRRIRGAANPAAARLADELRRYGIRFYSRPSGDRYEDWESTPPTFGPGPGAAPAIS
jgi:acetyltransferase-like isoleucine patch superfamily enzyme